MLIGAATVIVLAMLLLVYMSLAPSSFPIRQIVTIKQGTYLSQAADMLAADNIVKSPFLFKIFVMLLSGHRQMQAGQYLFDQPQSALRVAYRAVYGIQGLPKIKVTIFEGMTTKDIGASLKKSIPGFDAKTFLTLAGPLEGQLFPDTYYFYENVAPQDVIDLLHSTFIDKTKPLILQIQAFGKSPEEIITMASLVEKEATSSADRRIIAGVLWRRIAENMPLQVDPPFYYLFGKDSAQLTVTDLAVDSPYNLYKHTGLPPTPIDNPGLDAIEDTINPTKSDYLFFLSGRDGQMHYASTLAGHIANRTKYLE
jgi:UPF0755 protein